MRAHTKCAQWWDMRAHESGVLEPMEPMEPYFYRTFIHARVFLSLSFLCVYIGKGSNPCRNGRLELGTDKKANGSQRFCTETRANQHTCERIVRFHAPNGANGMECAHIGGRRTSFATGPREVSRVAPTRAHGLALPDFAGGPRTRERAVGATLALAGWRSPRHGPHREPGLTVRAPRQLGSQARRRLVTVGLEAVRRPCY